MRTLGVKVDNNRGVYMHSQTECGGNVGCGEWVRVTSAIGVKRGCDYSKAM